MDKNRPCYEKRIGSIRVAIWENTNDGNGTSDTNTTASTPRKWHNVAITRRFKVGSEWKEAPTLNGLGDLAQAALAVQLAIDWVRQRQESQPAVEEPNE